MKPQGLRDSDAARRKAHFGAGGTPSTWRGRSQKLDEAGSKARKMKRACREKAHEDGW